MSRVPWKPRGPNGFIAEHFRESPGTVISFAVVLFGQCSFLPDVEPRIDP